VLEIALSLRAGSVGSLLAVCAAAVARPGAREPARDEQQHLLGRPRPGPPVELSPHREGRRCFAAAHRAHDRLAAPCERARTVFAHAEVRRRWGRPRAARPLLLEAEATFAALGAHPWTARTRGELAATGHRSAGEAADDGASLEDLTPQEFRSPAAWPTA
jgi:hypothetical protein